MKYSPNANAINAVQFNAAITQCKKRRKEGIKRRRKEERKKERKKGRKRRR
jgi:hypothetical protein